ncbi:MAG: glycosyltransferase family 2 protein [Candidatus Thiodiazotropha taylori]
MNSVDICIATYKRPVLLKSLLNTLVADVSDCDLDVSIIVIDNDEEKSALEIVESVNLRTKLKITYSTQPIQNIALARNDAISISTKKYIVFIDDDELPEKNWLVNLVDAAIKFNADVVFGPVNPIYPDGTPNWIVAGKYFDRKRLKTGTLMPHGGTGNTLIKRHVFKEPGNLFDKKYGLTGGSDTELFSRLSSLNYRLIWCDEAVVNEVVERRRLTLKWLLFRAYRGGQVYYRVFSSKYGATKKLYEFVKRLTYIMIAVVIFFITLPFGKKLYVKGLRKIASNIGHISGMFGGMYEEYQKIN